jgi:hypothetical protein
LKKSRLGILYSRVEAGAESKSLPEAGVASNDAVPQHCFDPLLQS